MPTPSTTTPSVLQRPASRLAPCACASGRRYKDCCGALNRPAIAWEQQKNAALAAQRRGDISLAAGLYATVLAQTSDDDALHMLALCHYQLGCVPESISLFRRLLQQQPSPPDAVWQNLCLVVAAAACDPERPTSTTMREQYARWLLHAPTLPPESAPTIAVVIPCYNHEQYVGHAIRSVLAQTRLPDEIIIIDDGSRDGSVGAIRQALNGTRVPHQVIVRENRGAAETLNEAIDRSHSDWIAPLNSDDSFDRTRLAALVAGCARGGIEWGFGAVTVVDGHNHPFGRSATGTGGADMLYAVHDSLHMSESVGLAFLRNNPAISSGNLFFRKALWKRVGGFTPLRYNHDWQFCLSASMEAEPVFVPEAGYRYRWHDDNTIRANHKQTLAEATAMTRRFVKRAAATDAADSGDPHRNPFAPTASRWGHAFWVMVAAAGGLEAVPREQLFVLLDELASSAPARTLLAGL